MVALISLATYQLIVGPLATASRVTSQNLIKNQLSTIASIAVMDAVNQAASGDCDADGFVEPRAWRAPSGAPAPTNGGLIPLEIGVETEDPWGTEYGYCVWDVGPSDCGSSERLSGSADPTGGDLQTRTVLAIISAGADRAFQTTCNDYVDATTDLVTTSGDDIIKRFSYIEAASATSSLWSLSGDGTTASIDKDLAIGDDIEFDTVTGAIQALAVNATGKMTAGGGIGLGDQSDVSDESCTTSTSGLMRYNTVLDAVQLCLNDGSWTVLDNSVSFPLLAPDGSAAVPSYSFNNYDESGIFHDDNGMNIASTGDRMIFTPQTGLDFRMISEGGVQVGHTGEACTDDTQGTLRYVTEDKLFEYCDDSEWIHFNEP